ncbi:MAG: replicative DNA helicase, partial [Acidobacteria bacterium]|nr:replicative DNA helicase [Acidobacteriota bacterium]
MATQETLERPLPHNLDAERSILGAILLDSHALDLASEKLRPEEFFLDQHRRIFERMLQLQERREAIDTLTVMDELNRHGELESVGGAAYLGHLVDGVPRISHVEHYARIVREKALLRNLVHTAHSIQQKALEAEEGADDLLDNAESQIFQLAEERIRVGFVGVKDVVKESFER